jgi:PST family polysaccharide transporter
MKSPLRATALLGTTSIVGILAGVFGAKLRAIWLEPYGFALSALLQNLLSLAVLVGGLGVGTALVRYLARAAAESDEDKIASLRMAVWSLTALLGAGILVLVVVFRSQLSRLILGVDQPTDILVVGVAAVLALAFTINSSILNAYQQVGALAKLGLFNAVLGTTVALAVIAGWRLKGIAPALALDAAVGLAISIYYVRSHVPRISVRVHSREMGRSAFALLRFGAPYTSSQLVGTGVIQFAVPLLVLHTLGVSSVAYYQASTLIAGGYLSFLLAAMSQDYYPRLGAAGPNAKALVDLINQQQRLAVMVVLPLILFLLAAGPYIIPLVYSSAFQPSLAILDWQLTGDIFRISSWTLSFALLARGSAITFFFVEASAGILYVLASWLGMRAFGVVGLGLAWTVLYAAYFVIVFKVIRRHIPIVWTGANKGLVATSLAAVAIERLAALTHIEIIRLGIGLGLTTIATVATVQYFRREAGFTWHGVRALFSRTSVRTPK